jgi:hypothetical protein
MPPDHANIEAKMTQFNRQPASAGPRARLFPGLLAAALLFSVTACVGPTTLEQDYGRSVHNNIAQQLVNPQAGLDTTPAVGLPPQAASNEMDHYTKTFKGEEKKTLEMKLTTPSY